MPTDEQAILEALREEQKRYDAHVRAHTDGMRTSLWDAGIQARDEEARDRKGGEPLGRPEIPGENVSGKVAVAIAQLAFLAATGWTLSPIAGAALKTQAGIKALSALKKGLGVIGVDSPADAIQVIKAGVEVFRMANWWKKYGTLISTIVAILAGALTLFGAGAPAGVVESISKLLGGASPAIIGTVSVGTLLAACAALVKRCVSLWQKATGPAQTGEPTGGLAKIMWRWTGLIGMGGTVLVVVLGALGHPDAATQVNGLLALIGGQDPAIGTACATIVPAVLSIVTYVGGLIASKGKVVTLAPSQYAVR